MAVTAAGDAARAGAASVEPGSAQPLSANGTASGPLAGITVVDLTSTLMGPYCTLLLAQFGARVIKIESPAGDITRPNSDISGNLLGPIFINCNRGKESIVLDLADEQDTQVFRRLIARADVFTHNRPPGSIERLGIDYAALSKLNPSLVYCGMYGYGAAGPYRSRPAYDDVIQAVSGVADSQTGDGDPQYVRTPMTDKVTGIMAAYAIASALFERVTSGLGQAVEVPMFETAAQFLLVEQQGGHIYDPPRGPAGYARTNSPHRHPYRARDGLVSVLPYTDAHWQTLFELLDPNMLERPRFATFSRRAENVDELYSWLEAQVGSWTSAELLELLEDHRIPSAAVSSVEDLFADRHLNAVDFFDEQHQPGVGALRVARNPVGFSRSATVRVGPAPMLDQHGEDLRSELTAKDLT